VEASAPDVLPVQALPCQPSDWHVDERNATADCGKFGRAPTREESLVYRHRSIAESVFRRGRKDQFKLAQSSLSDHYAEVLDSVYVCL